MKKVGILGGTFNPPHIAHLIIANEVLDALKLDEIRFMPNYTPPHKIKTDDVPDDDRVAMLKLAIDSHPSFLLETIELERKGTSYTFDTIQVLLDREPNTEFYFIIGADMIEYLPNWHRIDELVELVTFVGVKRPGYEVSTHYPVEIVDIPEMLISSSLIRERVKQRKTIRYLVPDQVWEYMEGNGSYET
ncbi:nicotinate-nucleotide adenylyltransferase [Peribacillus loiseleuriae]|uniref:Probable nicotinate-nucleotide adenylyltransferase n=1 Tax=Peribacillus loiseleuriae TaxID=1679170 RepID=A0A0K9GW09_9BACI|nr:nicotinate-nucleotide adenylyltransferase [Peribacillus loiseleuriae]KMY50874.1 nicotinate-nucleotide adenylyltransferase [Peribacillus loiseleuriae]